MNQEQRIILKMLEEGKITADEAEALLNALKESHPLEEDEKQSDVWSRIEKQGEEFAERVEIAAERFARSVEAKTDMRLTEKLSRLPKMLAKFPFIGQEETHEFIQEFRGSLSEEVTEIPIHLATSNGRITVNGWDEPGYRLMVIQRIRGRDRDGARDRLYGVSWEDGEVADQLHLEIPNLNDISVSLHLSVPRERQYSVELRSHNGSLEVTNLEGTTMDLVTANGSTTLRQVCSQSVRGQISNGSCKMEQVEASTIWYRVGNGSYKLFAVADQFDCKSTNGSIHLQPLAVPNDSQIKLCTTNGSINVALPAWPDLGVAVELQTSVGRVSSQLGQMEYSHNERRGGGGYVMGRTADYEKQTVKLSLEASTSSGSISVTSVGSGGEEYSV